MPKNTELLREDWEPKPAGALYTVSGSQNGEQLPIQERHCPDSGLFWTSGPSGMR